MTHTRSLRQFTIRRAAVGANALGALDRDYLDEHRFPLVKIDAKRDCWSEYWRFLNGTTSRSRYRVHRGRLQEWVET